MYSPCGKLSMVNSLVPIILSNDVKSLIEYKYGGKLGFIISTVIEPVDSPLQLTSKALIVVLISFVPLISTDCSKIHPLPSMI